VQGSFGNGNVNGNGSGWLGVGLGVGVGLGLGLGLGRRITPAPWVAVDTWGPQRARPGTRASDLTPWR